jgi:hypothetical protein
VVVVVVVVVLVLEGEEKEWRLGRGVKRREKTSELQRAARQS